MPGVSYRLVADVAVALHFGFLVFLVVGGLAALRWRRLVWPHVVAVAWSVGIVTVGQHCPLTALERWATARAGGPVSDEGFIDRYVEDVVYPGSLTGPVRAAVAAVVVVSWLALCFPAMRRRLLHHRACLVAPPARLAARLSRSSVQPGVGAASPAPSLRSEGAGSEQGAGAGQEVGDRRTVVGA